MKGVLLFVRAAEPEDAPRMASFWKAEGRAPVTGSSALIGFLLGDVAAWLSFDREGDDLLIQDLWVAQNLRRKRVARALLSELDGEALRIGAGRLVIRPDNEFIEAFRRLGFSDASEGVLVRSVERAR